MATDDPLPSLGPPTSFDEVRALLRALPGPNEEARAKARAREATLTNPPARWDGSRR